MNIAIFSAVVLATLILTNIIAFLGRGKNTFLTYSFDPNSHITLRIALSMIGSIVGGGMFFGVGQIGFEAGITGYMIGISSLVGLFIAGTLSPQFRKAMQEEGVNNLIDLIERKFSARVAVAFSLVNGIIVFFFLAAQFLALYRFATFVSFDMGYGWIPWMLVFVVFVTLLFYPIIGGLRKDITSDCVQVTLIACMAIYFVFLFCSEKTFYTMWATLPVKHLTGAGYGVVFLIGVAFLYPAIFLVRMDVWQRIGAASDDRAATSAMKVAGVGSLLFYILFTSLGMWAYSTGITDAQNATLNIIAKVSSNPLIFGLVIGSLFAAVLSTADTNINNASLFFTRLLFPEQWRVALAKENTSNHTLLLKSRLLGLFLTFLSAGLAWESQDLVELMVGAFSLLLIFFPTVLGLLYPPWKSEKGAFFGVVLGVLCFLISFFTWNRKMAFLPGIAISALVYYVMCFFGQRTVCCKPQPERKAEMNYLISE